MNQETTDELMQATYVALCKHGYASLRMQDIADESTKSKATLHYHYDSKHALLSAFLDYLYEAFTARLEEADDETAPPAQRLRSVLESIFTPAQESTHQEFQTALLEIKAQGPYDEEYREHLLRFDRFLLDRLETILRDGTEHGSFRTDVDPEKTADFLVTVINGIQTRYVAVDHPIETTREQLLDDLLDRVVTEDAHTEVNAE